jgi:protein regulator of cytokinesis 1
MDTSYLSSQVSTIIGQLHGLFDEIGVPSHEREARESEVSYLKSLSASNMLTSRSCLLRSPRLCTIKYD